jgi:hypothetical protein
MFLILLFRQLTLIKGYEEPKRALVILWALKYLHLK